jgi:hypothetical protein
LQQQAVIHIAEREMGEALQTCTVALVTAGVMPKLSSSDVEITPNAMPSAPSTSCANPPIRKKTMISCVIRLFAEVDLVTGTGLYAMASGI